MQYRELIKELQLKMNQLGAGLKIDGDLGAKTLAELSKWQVHIALSPIKKLNQLDSPSEEVLRPAIELIKEFEGYYEKAYLCPAGVPTIGWGTICYPSGKKVQIGDVCNPLSAELYLKEELHGIIATINRIVTREISNNAFCALVSFCYNLGTGALEKSTLLKRLNAGEDLEMVAVEFHKWVNANGVPLKGLIRRRKAEAILFLE